MKDKLKSFYDRNKEYLITVIAGTMWGLFYLAHWLWGITVIPLGYISTLFFGLICVNIVNGIVLWWMQTSFPYLREKLDPESKNKKELTEWEKTKLALVLYVAYGSWLVYLVNKF